MEILDDILWRFDWIDVAQNWMDKVSIKPDPFEFGMAEIIKMCVRIDDGNLF